jgi:hypothetical protein
MTEKEPEDDDRDDEDEDEEESPPPPKAKKPAARKPSDSRGKSAAPQGPTMVPSSRALAIGIIALAVGGGAGWFGQLQKTKATMRAEDAAPVGSGAPSGPCASWQSKICATTGAQSASCQQAKGAADLLMPSTCDAALASVSETLARVKAARASCDTLVSKLCAELTPGSKTCAMVKERTPSFPRERCDQMLTNYDKVIAELKQMDQQQSAPGMGGPGMGAPGMGAPHMPPGMSGGMPHITIPPQGAPAHS